MKKSYLISIACALMLSCGFATAADHGPVMYCGVAYHSGVDAAVVESKAGALYAREVAELQFQLEQAQASSAPRADMRNSGHGLVFMTVKPEIAGQELIKA